MTNTFEIDPANPDIARACMDNGQPGAWHFGMELTVERLHLDHEGRMEYRWEVWGRESEGAKLTLGQRGKDLYTGVRIDPGPARMLATLANFLGACAESYAYEMRTGVKGENYDLFNARVRSWAYQFHDELAMLQLEIEED